MDPDLQASLYGEFPGLLSDLVSGVECGDGWHRIIRCCLETLSRRSEGVRVAEIRESWGGLRISAYDPTGVSAGACDLAERLSHWVCEDCGMPGECRRFGRRYRTLCGSCREAIDSVD